MSLNIIVSGPKSDQREVNREINAQIAQDIRERGSHNPERRREQEAAALTRELKGRKSMIGRSVAEIPAHDYHRIVTKYGKEEVQSKGFVKYWNKEFPHLSPNNA